jgi:CRISPR/Cas system-associated protein Cas10 (large subunit of type III CRISPR-Cas system)
MTSSNPPSKWSDPQDNLCEICGEQATEGILGDERDIQTRIRYVCPEHYVQLYDKIQAELKEEEDRGESKRNDSKE